MSALFNQLSECAKDVLIQEITRLRAELAARDWQPIETAPKDGTRIIICSNGMVFEGKVWKFYETEKNWIGEVIWWDSGWYMDQVEGWMVANCDEEYGVLLEASHWMPLPPPPQRENP